ncbi:MAG: hypothetical protein AAF632_02430 [Bacteroidota bacterium]
MDTIHHHSRYPSRLLLLLILLLLAALASAQNISYDNSSLVIVKAPELSGEQYSQLSTALASDHRYSLEYTCLQSGVIVLRYYHNFTEKGDIGRAIKTELRRRGKLTKLEVIYVDISQESSAQC